MIQKKEKLCLCSFWLGRLLSYSLLLPGRKQNLSGSAKKRRESKAELLHWQQDSPSALALKPSWRENCQIPLLPETQFLQEMEFDRALGWQLTATSETGFSYSPWDTFTRYSSLVNFPYNYELFLFLFPLHDFLYFFLPAARSGEAYKLWGCLSAEFLSVVFLDHHLSSSILKCQVMGIYLMAFLFTEWLWWFSFKLTFLIPC